MAELDDKTFDQIDTLCGDGDDLAESGEFAAALDKYTAAWDLLPAPKHQWEAATWILAAIGDANFLSGSYEESYENFSEAMKCPDAIGNPFLHLRLGQCSLELDKKDQAADELTRAYGLEGKDLFVGEDEKYFEFLKTRIELN